MGILNRERAVKRIQRRLTDRGWPRLQVSAAFLVAGLVAFGSSFALLRLGLSNMAIRYVLATCVAYAAFLLLLRLIVGAIRRRVATGANSADVLDLALNVGPSGPFPGTPTAAPVAEEPVGAMSDLPIPDLDEGLVVLVPALILGAGLISSLYVVYVAPVLLAELILDVVIVSGLVLWSLERFHRERALLTDEVRRMNSDPAVRGETLSNDMARISDGLDRIGSELARLRASGIVVGTANGNGLDSLDPLPPDTRDSTTPRRVSKPIGGR